MSLAASYPLISKHKTESFCPNTPNRSARDIPIVTHAPEDNGDDMSEITGLERQESLGSNGVECCMEREEIPSTSQTSDSLEASTSLLKNLHVDEPAEMSSDAKLTETLTGSPLVDRETTFELQSTPVTAQENLSNRSKHTLSHKESSSNQKSQRFMRKDKDDRDWDQLRKRAEAGGRKQRPDNTRDSLDWEAVRQADVGEVADAIKERGMHEKLSQRIQVKEKKKYRINCNNSHGKENKKDLVRWCRIFSSDL